MLEKRLHRLPSWTGLTVVLILCVAALYPTVLNGFTNWDDPGFITDNKLVKTLSWEQVKVIFSNHDNHLYMPFTTLYRALLYHVFGPDAFVFHLTNLVLHLANVILLFILLTRLVARQWIVLFTTFTFAIHPMHVEPVAWVIGNVYLLYSLFYLATLIGYIKYLETHSPWWFAGALACFVGSLGSSIIGVTLAPALFVIDYYLGRHINSRLVLEKVPFFLLSLGAGILGLWLAAETTYHREAYTFLDSVWMAGYSLLFYGKSFVIPWPVSAFYPYPAKINGYLPALFLASPLLLAALVAVGWKYYRANRLVLAGILFFGINMAINLKFSFLAPYGEYFMANRYTYLPYIGLGLALGAILEKFLQSPRSVRYLTMGLLAVFGGCLIYLTHQRTKVWENSFTLWSDVTKQYPGAALPWVNRGNYLYEINDKTAAIADFSNALRADTLFYKAAYNRGKLYQEMGEDQKALADYNRVIQLNNRHYKAFNNRAYLLYERREYRAAIDDYSRAIAIKPVFAKAYYNRSFCYYQLQDLARALQDVEKAKSLGMAINEEYRQHLEKAKGKNE